MTLNQTLLRHSRGMDAQAVAEMFLGRFILVINGEAA